MYFNMVPREGLEPPPLARPEPKSGASANFATGAIFLATIYTTFKIAFYLLVPRPGLEPGTPALSRRCSNQLSYRGIMNFKRPTIPTEGPHWIVSTKRVFTNHIHGKLGMAKPPPLLGTQALRLA